MDLIGIPSAMARSVWPKVVGHIEECLSVFNEHRWHSDDILASIEAKDMQLWVLSDSGLKCTVVTEIITYPRAKECNIFLVAGEIPGGWDEPLEKMAQWAKEQGCTHVSTSGRPGVARKFKDLGYDIRQTYCVRGI